MEITLKVYAVIRWGSMKMGRQIGVHDSFSVVIRLMIQLYSPGGATTVVWINQLY